MVALGLHPRMFSADRRPLQPRQMLGQLTGGAAAFVPQVLAPGALQTMLSSSGGRAKLVGQLADAREAAADMLQALESHHQQVN